MFLACNIMFSLLFDNISLAKSRLKTAFWDKRSKWEPKWQDESDKKEENLMQPFFSPLIQVL